MDANQLSNLSRFGEDAGTTRGDARSENESSRTTEARNIPQETNEIVMNMTQITF